MRKKKSDLEKKLITNSEKQNSLKIQWTVSEQVLKQIAAYAIDDSLRMYGLGLPSYEANQRWFDIEKIKENYKNLERGRVITNINRWLESPVNFLKVNEWTAEEQNNFMQRTMNLNSILDKNTEIKNGISQDEINSHLGISASQFAIFNKQILDNCFGAQFFIKKYFEFSCQGKKEGAWKCGLSHTDILEVYSGQILGPNDIYLDIKIIRMALDRYNETSSQEKTPRKRHLDGMAVAHNWLVDEITKRIEERMAGVKAAIRYCNVLNKLEHEAIIDPHIDNFCVSFGQHNSYGIYGPDGFKLGERGHLKLGLPFHYSVKCEKPIKYVKPPNKIENDEMSSMISALVERMDGIAPLAGSRGLLIWLGGKHSFDRAKSELCKLIPSAIRTAWLVTIGCESALGYLIDPLFTSNDGGERGPEVNFNFSKTTEDIKKFPVQFPVFEWIQQSIDHVFNVGENSGQSPDFLANALLLLREADDMMSISPRQTFACSMSAVEVCLGGKGGELSQRIVQRMSRLLINQNNLRTTAEKLFLLLYELRSKIVHGDMCEISLEAAVFMRYVASCVVFNAGGFSKTLARMGVAGSAKDIRSELDSDKYGEQLLPGVLECKYLLHLIRAGLEKPDEWKQFSAGF